MRTALRARVAPAVLGSLLAVAAAVCAEDAPPETPAAAAAKPRLPFALSGAISAGYRLVDVDGSRDRYDEDYNLHSGGRLFLFSLDGEAREPAAVPLDRFHLEIDTPGDEPVSRFVLTAEDRSLYELRVDFVRSQYLYDVPQLFAAPVAGDVRLGDLHTFDVTRTNGTAALRLHPPGLPTFVLGYRFYQRAGDGTSTVLVPGGDGYRVEAPGNVTTHVGSLGTEFEALGTAVFVEQAFRRVNRTVGRHGPLGRLGLDPADGLVLESWQGVGSDHIDIPVTTVRLRRDVGERLTLTGAYRYAHAALSSSATRYRNGDSTIPQESGPSTRIDDAGASLDTQIADLGATIRLTPLVSFDLDYRFDERSQNGDLSALSTTSGTLDTTTRQHVRVQRVTGALEVRPLRSLRLRAGIRWARRDAFLSTADQSETTDLVGALAEARWKPWRRLELWGRYENIQIDDPWTIAGDTQSVPVLPAREIGYTFTNRGTAGLRAQPWTWLRLSYELGADSFENADFRGRAQRFSNTASVTVTPRPDLQIVAGYTRRDLDTSALALIAPRYAGTFSAQTGTEDVVTSTLSYDFTLLRHGWSTGWNVAWIDAQNTLRPGFEPGLPPATGYDLDRIDAGVFLTFRHPFLEPGIEVRRIQYTQRPLRRNDYDATIAVFRLTRRFDF